MENNIIRFNTYKLERGGLLYDMYDQFNARVGDQGTPLVMQWLQGLADTEVDLQAQKLHFYATGQVGKYLEKLKDGTGYQMSADASQVEYEDRNAAGTMGHGITKVKLPKQFFPQEGIFYGYFGLKDAQGNTYTSINVWFRVLGGVPIMGAAIPYLSTRFDELMETFKGRAADALAELRQEYLDEVKKNEDMSAETRAALEKLAASVGAIQAQIDAGNVVTLIKHNQDINRISHEIEDRLSKINNDPHSFKDLDAVKAAYPNGADGIFVLDNGHRAVFRDGQWIDGGVYQAAGLSDEVMESLGDLPYNLIKNGSFSSGDIKPNEALQGTATVIDNLGKKWAVVTSGDQKLQYVGIQFPVKKYDTLKYYGFKFNFDIFTNIDTKLKAQIIYYNKDNSRLQTADLRSIETERWALYHGDIRLTFDPTFFDQADHIALEICDPAEEQVQINITGVSLEPQLYQSKASGLNLIENGNFASGSIKPNQPMEGRPTVIELYNRQWAVVTSGSQKRQYVGMQFPVKKYDIYKYYGFKLNFDVFTSIDTKLKAQVIYYDQNDKRLNTVTFRTIKTQAWGLYHADICFMFDPNLYDQADHIMIGVCDTADEVVQIDITGVSLMPVLTQHKPGLNLIQNGDFSSGSLKPSEGLQGGATITETLGRRWAVVTSGDQKLQYVGMQFPVEKYDTLKYYTFKLKFDVFTNIDTTLVAQIIYYDADDKRLASVTQLNIETQAWGLYHADINLRFDPTLYDQADHIAIEVCDLNNEAVQIDITGVSLEPQYYQVSNHQDTTSQITATLPVMKLNGSLDGMSGTVYKPLTFTFTDGDQVVSGYADTKWQGNSSLNYAKKAYRIKTFSDSAMTEKLKFRPCPEWGPGAKWNLKAYYTDAILGRDAVNAKLGGKIWATEKEIPDELITTNNFGFVDGFPILLYVNDKFAGVYSFNIPKGDYGDAATVICGNQYTDASTFTKLPEGGVKLDGSDFDMVSPDKPTDALKQEVNELVTFVSTSTDNDFKANFESHFNKESMIDYCIFNNLIANTDAWVKNQTLITYDGKIWYLHPYDLDCSYGIQFEGKINPAPTSYEPSTESTLYRRFETLFEDDIKKRWGSLRTWLTPASVIDEYRKWVSAVGEGNYEQEFKLWNNPSHDTNDFNFTKARIYHQFKILDQAWL